MGETKRAPSDGRVAVVTGGARGIGWATVQALVADGVRPVLLDRDEAALADASRRLAERGVDHHAATLDVTDEAAVERAMAAVGRALRPARHPRQQRRHRPAPADARARRSPTGEKVVDVNLNAVFLCARAAGADDARRRPRRDRQRRLDDGALRRRPLSEPLVPRRARAGS